MLAQLVGWFSLNVLLGNGEVALYCHAERHAESEHLESGWKFEKIAFHALPPDESPDLVPVYEFCKDGSTPLTYYAHPDCDGFKEIESFGWTRKRVAFCVKKTGLSAPSEVHLGEEANIKEL